MERQPDGQYARIQAKITIPIEIVYLDANGQEGKALGSIVLNEDVLMFVPPASVMPFTVSAIASCVSPEGRWDPVSNSFILSACLTVILKVSMQVEILVPSYGYCAIPPAQEYSQEVCTGFFELPLYPQGRTPAKDDASMHKTKSRSPNTGRLFYFSCLEGELCRNSRRCVSKNSK